MNQQLMHLKWFKFFKFLFILEAMVYMYSDVLKKTLRHSKILFYLSCATSSNLIMQQPLKFCRQNMFERKLSEIREWWSCIHFYLGSWKERCPLAHDKLPRLKGMYTRDTQFNRNHQYGMFLTQYIYILYRVSAFGIKLYIFQWKVTMPLI